jgi:multiple sugar transport system substrate-binding protein
MHKAILFAIIVLLLSIGSVAAQNEDPLAGVDPSGQTVVYWHQWAGAQLEAINDLIARFNETNEWGITVEGVPQGLMGDINNLMSAGITTGNLPNLAASFQDTAQSYYLDGAVVPLDLYFDHPVWGFTEEEIENLNLDLININRIAGEPFNNQLLLWPIGVSANVMSINMEMLAEVGYDRPPQTLEELREIVCATPQLTRPDGQQVQGYPLRTSATDLLSFAASQGGYIFDEENDRYDFTNDGVITVLEFFKDIYDSGCAYIPDGPFISTDDMAFGLNPMGMGSSVGIPFINNNIRQSGSGIENWIMTTTPWSDDNRSLLVFLTSLIIVPSTPEEQLATWLFIKYMASNEAQIEWTERVNYQPYTISAAQGLSEEFIANVPQFGQVRDLFLDDSIRIISTPMVVSFNQVSGILAELIANVTAGGQDVLSAAQLAEAEANAIHEAAQASLR